MCFNLFRLVLFLLVVVMVVYAALQLFEVSKQYQDSLGVREISIREHAQNIMQRTCKETFPVPDGVRIFSDGREVRHIAFLKVHKAASGSATSIFFRFGTTRKLKFLRPKWLNIVSSSETISDKQIHNGAYKPFDIMTSHVIYNRAAFEKYLHNDSAYIGIVREPYIQFKSSMNYMAPKYVYNISDNDPIQQYLRNPSRYEQGKGPRFSWINNRQATEFGTPDQIIITQNVTAMNEYVQKLDKEFHLVIIAEYFDESVVLMRRMLNWKLSDILYRRLHIRGWDRKQTIPKAHDRRLYRKWAFADYAIYDFFFQRLWRQIRQAGEDFFQELLFFKQVREEMDDFCKVYPNISTTYIIQKSQWNPKLVIDKELCGQIFSEEEDWVKVIATPEYNNDRMG